MIRSLQHNLALKLIALATAVMIWAYAGTQKTSEPTRQILAAVQPTGSPPPGLSVDIKSDFVTAAVSGPQLIIDALQDGAIRAVVDLTTVRPDTRRLKVDRFVPPPEAPNLTFPVQTRTVEVAVRAAARKRLQVAVSYRGEAPFGKRFGPARAEPGWVDVEGPRDLVEQVVAVQAPISPAGRATSADVPLNALDRAGVVVEGVRIDPPTAHVEMAILELTASRTLVVSPVIRGRAAPPFVISDVVCEPQQITVIGAPDDLLPLTSVPTVPVAVDGIRADTTRQVALDLPPRVAVRDGRSLVEVVLRVRDTSHTPP